MDQPRRRVAYIMSRFPKLSETFVLDEMIAMQEWHDVEVFPLWRHNEPVVHNEAIPFVERAHFRSWYNARVVNDNLYWLSRSPLQYIRVLFEALISNKGSLRFFAAALALWPVVVSFARELGKLRIDHVHAHFASHPALAAWILGRLTGVTWSFTAHGSDLHRNQTMLDEKVADSKFVIAISRYNKQFIIDHSSSTGDGIEVIHCGVPEHSGQMSAGMSERIFQICCTGTLHEVKGQAYLLEACALLENEEWRCHLIGEGPDRTKLQDKVRELGLEDKVIFHGSLRKDEVLKVLQSVDVVCAPSVLTKSGRREGIPVALIEAAALGVPLVASRISGIPELVRDGETGLLTEPGEPLSIATALTALQVSKERCHQLGSAARCLVQKEFNVRRNAGLLAELISRDAKC